MRGHREERKGVCGRVEAVILWYSEGNLVGGGEGVYYSCYIATVGL